MSEIYRVEVGVAPYESFIHIEFIENVDEYLVQGEIDEKKYDFPIKIQYVDIKDDVKYSWYVDLKNKIKICKRVNKLNELYD